MIASGINLVMTVIGFTVSTMFIVFVCTRLICARIQLNASRRSFPTATRSELSLLQRGLHGLEPFVVATFSTKKFSDEYFSSAEDTQCTVCLAEYQDKDILRILPYCGHAFHVTCIDIWLHHNSTCPVCRISLRDSPERANMPPLFSSAVRTPYNGTETFDLHAYHCVYNSPGYSSRTQYNQRMESIQEDNNCTPDLEGMEAGDVSAATDCNRVLKDGSYEHSRLSQCKHRESPSTP
ncbi:RING-H2 finger protein ATL40-like [Aristolochia californica]|uniref:RING-H2 finger protein ATL40-like n=1 Tax=Aristolochia californica TaxID=171875 RepID=UPI0035D92A3C